MDISVVTTLYQSEQYIDAFYTRITTTIQSLKIDSYEIIFVNDGSPDHSLARAIALHQKDAHVTVIDLSRNFGHHKAIMTGLAHAKGDFVFLIDSDLEEQPELLTPFYEKIHSTSADVVYGVQTDRQDNLTSRLASRAFYRIFNALSQHPIPKNLLTIRIMRQEYVQALLEHQEQEFVISVLWQMTGFVQIPFIIDKLHKGKTTYNLSRKIDHVIRAVTATSNKPLVYIAYLGGILTIPAGGYIVFILFRYVFWGIEADGWLSLIVSVWFLGGLNILILGIIALYLSVIFTETKKRPYTIVRRVYQHQLNNEKL